MRLWTGPPRKFFAGGWISHHGCFLTTREKLYTIGRSCGFQDAQQLTRVFTREVGMPPSRYRQRQGQTAEK